MSRTWPIFLVLLLVLVGIASLRLSAPGAPTTTLQQSTRPFTVTTVALADAAPALPLLSPYWPDSITRWSNQIYKVAYTYGLDPDLVAAVVYAESRGQADVESYAGAVGLMGIMSYGPGLEWRPTAVELRDPETNLRWGASILADILLQTEGDVFAALAAYNGGWQQANATYTRAYAADVLNNYAQAVVVRHGGDTDASAKWTIVIEKNRGYVPQERYLVLGEYPATQNNLMAEHVVYQAIDRRGTAYYVKGYAVPLKVPPEGVAATGQAIDAAAGVATSSRSGEDVLVGEARPNVPTTATATDKSRIRAPRVLLACLPSLERLRGQVSSRWFAPSTCPAEVKE